MAIFMFRSSVGPQLCSCTKHGTDAGSQQGARRLCSLALTLACWRRTHTLLYEVYGIAYTLQGR